MAIPVFASGASVPSEDTYRVSFNNDQLTFRTERTSYTIDDADSSNLIKIPLYFWYSSSSADNTYMSGWVIMAQSRFMNFTFNTGSVVPSYFEAYDGGSYYCSSPVSDYRFTVYFDNHIATNNTPLLLGYYVFDVSAYTAIQIDVTSGTTNVNIASSGVYGSTGEYGLVQSIINGLDNSDDIDTIIGALQNIDTVDLEAIISGISSNTSLLTQIYQRLGQMQTADNQFYSDIDNIIDSVSWVDTGWSLKGLTYDFTNYYLDSTARDYCYIVLDNINPRFYTGLYHIRFRLDLRNNNYNNILGLYWVYGSNSNKVPILNYTTFSNRDYIDIFFTFNDDLILDYSNPYYIAIYCKRVSITSSSYNRFQYIDTNDVEFWEIYDCLQTIKLYNLIESYINANVSNPVNQAATQAAGLAIDQHAAEASLEALSPADMGDFDSAVSEITILDDVSQSLVFWTNAVNAFSLRSGSLWGVFIFGLLIGLIAFILRLRR